MRRALSKTKDSDSAYVGLTANVSTPRLWFIPSLSGTVSVGEVTDANGVSRLYLSGGGTRTAGGKSKGGLSLTGNAGYFDGSTEEFAGPTKMQGGSVGAFSGERFESSGKAGWGAGFGPGIGTTYYDGKVNTATSPAISEDLKILFPFLMLPGAIRSLVSSKRGLL